MSVRKKLLALVAVVGLGFAPVLSATTAQATPPPDPIENQAIVTGNWIANQFVANPDGPGKCIVSPFTQKCGPNDDAALSLIQLGGHDAVVEDYVIFLESQIDTYPTSSGQAGRVALVVTATGRDATNFAGVNLVAMAQEKYTDMYGGTDGGLAILGILKGGGTVGDGHMNLLLDKQLDNGSFYGPDATAVAILAMKAYQDAGGALDVSANIANAMQWLQSNELTEPQSGGTYWNNFNPVNSSAYTVQAYQTMGLNTTPLLNYLVAQDVNGDGEFEFCEPSTNCGSTAFATFQAGAAFGNVTLDNLGSNDAMPVANILLFAESNINKSEVNPGDVITITVGHTVNPADISIDTSWLVDMGNGEWVSPDPSFLNFTVSGGPTSATINIIPTSEQSGMRVKAVAENKYYAVSAESTEYGITVTGNSTGDSLKFTVEPQSVKVFPGYAYEFSYDHTGKPEPKWALWQVNTGDGWALIDPAKVNYAVSNKSLTVIPTVDQYNMQIRVVLVKPDNTTLASEPATLLSPDYTFIQMPQNQLVRPGTVASFSVDYLGAPGTLLWQYTMDGQTWLMLDPATINYAVDGLTLHIIPTKALNGAQIRAAVYGINGELIISDPAKLAVI